MVNNNILKKIVEILSFKKASKKNGSIILGTGTAIFLLALFFSDVEYLLYQALFVGLPLLIWGLLIYSEGKANAERIKEEEIRKNVEEKRRQELKVRDEKMAEISDLWPYGAQAIPVAQEIDDEGTIKYKCAMARIDWKNEKYVLYIWNHAEDKLEYTVAVKPTGMFALKDGQAYRISKERFLLDQTFIVCSKESNSRVGDIISFVSSFANVKTIRSAEIPEDEEILEMMQKYHYSMNNNILHCNEFNVAEVLVDALAESYIYGTSNESELSLVNEESKLFYEFCKANRITDEDYKERIGNEQIALRDYVNTHSSSSFREAVQENTWNYLANWPGFKVLFRYFVSLINKGNVYLQPYGCVLDKESDKVIVMFRMPIDETLWENACQHKELLSDNQNKILKITHSLFSTSYAPTVDILVKNNMIHGIIINEKENYLVIDNVQE